MNKIGWCDITWNPVWGCRNKCEYCYARGIAKRFGNVMAENEYYSRYWGNKRCAKGINKAEIGRSSESLRAFKPTFLHSQFNKKLPKKPQRIFVGSMSEIAYWKAEWIEKVFNKIREYPQHTFIFLTKFPEVYRMYAFPINCWLGVTITKETDTNGEHFKKFKTQYIVFLLDINNAKSNIDHKRFISFEPLLENINLDFLKSSSINWVIIGAETGNRKSKVIPKLDWVLEIVRYCEHHKIPVYIKDNLTKYYAECRGYKQFPIQGE